MSSRRLNREKRLKERCGPFVAVEEDLEHAFPAMLLRSTDSKLTGVLWGLLIVLGPIPIPFLIMFSPRIIVVTDRSILVLRTKLFSGGFPRGIAKRLPRENGLSSPSKYLGIFSIDGDKFFVARPHHRAVRAISDGDAPDLPDELADEPSAVD